MKKCDTLYQYLSSIEYIYMPSVNSVADCLFAKRVGRDLFLLLGITYSRYEKDMFTGSFYLSKITVFGAVWGDIPMNSYRRVGVFLEEKERSIFLNDEYCQKNMVDAWWNINDLDSIAKFKNAVELSEVRFMTQDNLFDSINSSLEIKVLNALSETVIEIVTEGMDDLDRLLKVSRNKIKGDWLEIAEIVLRNGDDVVSEKLIDRLAYDAWRKTYIRNQL